MQVEQKTRMSGMEFVPDSTKLSQIWIVQKKKSVEKNVLKQLLEDYCGFTM